MTSHTVNFTMRVERTLMDPFDKVRGLVPRTKAVQQAMEEWLARRRK